MSRPILDLTRQAWAQRHGDILAIGTWFGELERRPCLVLLNYSKLMRRDPVVPVIVPMDNIYLWSEIQGVGDVAHAAKSANGMAGILFNDSGNSYLAYRIAGVIRDHIQDVIEIPPEPTDRHVVAAEAIYTVDGKEHYKEIREHE